MASLNLVMYDPSGKLQSVDRSFVRSRCMLGKNKREGSRRSKRERRKETAGSKVPINQVVQLPSPPLLGLQLTQTPELLDSVAHELLYRAFAYNITNYATSALDGCVDFDCLDSPSFHGLVNDLVALHSILAASSAVTDLIRHENNPGPDTGFYLGKTVSILSKTLDRNDAYQEESVLYAVTTLALVAAVFGDWEAAAAHLTGLQRIVQLRGGLEFLSTRTKLHFKLDRLDLAWSLSTGGKPFFAHSNVPWGPLLPTTEFATSYSVYRAPRNWDAHLRATIKDFQVLSITVNRYTHEHVHYDATSFQKLLSVLQSRLTFLEGMLAHPTAELVRLTLLAVLTTAFKLPGRKISYTWIAKRIQSAYSVVVWGSDFHNQVLRTWVLAVAAISVIDDGEPWLSQAWRHVCQSMCWEDVKERLLRVVWIEVIHDVPGKLAVQQLSHPAD